MPGRVNFVAGPIEGSGTILDVSVDGAHVFQPSDHLEPGTKVDMYFLQGSTGRRLHALSEVVRRTEFGFAVRFLRVERELTTLVLNAVNDEQSAQ